MPPTSQSSSNDTARLHQTHQTPILPPVQYAIGPPPAPTADGIQVKLDKRLEEKIGVKMILKAAVLKRVF